MKLEEFVKQTLLDITNGVAAAQEETKLFIAPGVVEGKKVTASQNVSFEIAVTVTGEGNGSISVLGLGTVGGSGTREAENRISFEVPCHFNAPTRANPRHYTNLGPLNPVAEEDIQ